MDYEDGRRRSSRSPELRGVTGVEGETRRRGRCGQPGGGVEPMGFGGPAWAEWAGAAAGGGTPRGGPWLGADGGGGASGAERTCPARQKTISRVSGEEDP